MDRSLLHAELPLCADAGHGFVAFMSLQQREAMFGTVTISTAEGGSNM